jgi:hypothetical protein
MKWRLLASLVFESEVIINKFLKLSVERKEKKTQVLTELWFSNILEMFGQEVAVLV